jgi:glycosyltransferase involved in cell wall biosynthesis
LREAQRQNRAKRNSQTKGKPSEKLISNFLFLAHCTEAKGLFDALESLKLGNKRLEEVGQAFRMRLTVAGEFVNPQEKCRFNQLLDNEKLGDFVNYVGFVSGQSKKELLTYSECLLCPTHWDNFPTTILEAMAFDLPVIVSDCGSLPDMFPKGYGWICRTHSISDLTNKMIEFSKSSGHLNFRDYYLENFSSEVFIRKISESILSCSQS